MFEESEYSFTLIKKELSSRWKELWMNIEKMRFSFNPKEAFKKLQTVTKYHCFEKRDGSIISKVKGGQTTISAPDEVRGAVKIESQRYFDFF